MRYKALDAWRGLACVGMFFFHVEAVRVFVMQSPSVWLFDWPGVLLGQLVRISFLMLVGISTYLIYKKYNDVSKLLQKQSLRFLKVGLGATVITLVSYVVVPQYFIVFGILHLIAVSNLLLLGFIKLPKWLNFAIGLLLILLGYINLQTNLGKWLNLLLGYPYSGFTSFDYFPILPWFGYVLIGFSFGSLAVKLSGKINISDKNILVLLGKRALEFYIIHLALIFVFWKLVLISVEL